MKNFTRRAVTGISASLLLLVAISAAPAPSQARVVRRVYPEQPRYAFTPELYFTGRVGLFEPNDETDGLEGFSSGFFGGIGIGYRSAPYLAFEGE
ncbi:MAG: hypothetical protein GTN70_00725, partial [Deltaproteobacteria bacterium]|nr:hypothetical protein [Deltaproteobacteria bacterium]NIS76178.1 hypothetical protein [Deltaproteobacteria bacterium]